MDAFKQTPWRLTRFNFGKDLSNDVMSEGSIDWIKRVFEGVEGIDLVAVDNTDTLCSLVGLEAQGEVEPDVGGPKPLFQDSLNIAVPGNLAIVIPRKDDHRVIFPFGEVHHRVGEVLMRSENRRDVSGPRQHLETISVDNECSGPGHVIEDCHDLCLDPERVWRLRYAKV